MSFLLASLIFFLAVSLLFYVLFAGADFGAGILEVFLGKTKREEQRRLISHAMAPVWEANHVWLILAVVILFMGFPKIYTTISTYLYLPVLAVLIGIVGRGCAFTFRYYDVYQESTHRQYNRIFAFSSVWTSFFLGVIAGAIMLGRISPGSYGFREAYIFPWFNWFSASVGLFTCALFAFLTAVYLIGEAEDDGVRRIFQRKASLSRFAVLGTGALVFLAAELEGLPLFHSFFTNGVSVACFIQATVLWIPFHIQLKEIGKSRRQVWIVRGLAAAIVGSVLFGWFAVRYPVVIQLAPASEGLTFQATAAPEATQWALLGALLVGSLLIFPALGYLLKVFKW